MSFFQDIQLCDPCGRMFVCIFTPAIAAWSVKVRELNRDIPSTTWLIWSVAGSPSCVEAVTEQLKAV